MGKVIHAGRLGNLGRGLFLVLAATLLCGPGCTRRFFRRDADREVVGLLDEKDIYEPWKVEQWHVYPDPRARFADPANPDRPPKPFDDPAAAEISPCPQKPGKAGCGSFEGDCYLQLVAGWDAANRAERTAADKEVEQNASDRPPAQPDKPKDPPGPTGPPSTPSDGSDFDALLRTKEKPYLLKLEQTSELGLFNSREFQDRREDLYLAALPVTLQRFAFAYQFFATEQVIREATGSKTAEGEGNRWRANTTAGFSKLFPTGALLMFRFANQVIVEMSGTAKDPRLSTPSSLTLDATQPLLRGGGRAVTLEPLTQAERNFLYVIRSYARFREEFYVAIAAGAGSSFGNGNAGPDFAGNFAPPGPLAESGRFTGDGFLPVLLRAAQLVNARENVASLESFLRLFRAIQEGGDVQQLQVDQVEQQLLSGRSTVLQNEQDLRDALDRFKQQLGLPPIVPLELDDTPLRPVIQQLRRFQQSIDQFDAVRVEAERLANADPSTVRAALRRIADTTGLVRGTQFRERFPQRWAEWERLSNDELEKRLSRVREERQKLLGRRSEAETGGRPLTPAERARLIEVDAETGVGRFEAQLRRYEAQPWRQPRLDEARQGALKAALFRDLVAEFVLVLSEARTERIDQVRGSWPALPRVCLVGTDLIDIELDQAQTKVAQSALTNRFDLMNARARVVDAWRQVAVQANSLLGVANVSYHLDSATPLTGTNPFAFSGSRTRNQLIFDFEAPLVRKLERNNYRTALIAFQRQRRVLQAAEDDAVAQVRSELRQLRAIAENYKIQQRAIELAYLQVEDALNVFQTPPPPAAAGGGGAPSAGNAAALTQQLLSAQSQLPTTKNRLYSVYLSYLIVRLQLYRDLDRMPLDARGVWMDELATRDCTGPDLPRAPAGPEAVGQPERLPEPRVLTPTGPAPTP